MPGPTWHCAFDDNVSLGVQGQYHRESAVHGPDDRSLRYADTDPGRSIP